MGTLISLALDEICLRGSTGISLRSLWTTLVMEQPLLPSMKLTVLASLLTVPTLTFSLSGRSVNAEDPIFRQMEDAVELDLRIIASEHLRDCFLGLYDIPSSKLPANQLRALERIALARDKGITQNQLAKEFGMEGNHFFYIVRKLEARGLIVRQQAVVKTTEARCRGGRSKTTNSTCVTTNLIYLYRYAKHLTGQQRFEINKEAQAFDNSVSDDVSDTENGGTVDESFKDDVFVRDYLPSMKAICNKLEEAHGKVLVVSDIKRDLNYSGRFGHRAWRNICHRLKDAHLVEEFDGRINGKVERCLRLLKSISSMDMDSKYHGLGAECSDKKVVKFGRRHQNSGQSVELAIDHQIYDMIDSEGTKGALLVEVCNKLGLSRKRNDSRLNSLLGRFGMHKQEESHKRTEAYRVWTQRNSNKILSENKDSNMFEEPEENVHLNSMVNFNCFKRSDGCEFYDNFVEKEGDKCIPAPCDNNSGRLHKPDDPTSEKLALLNVVDMNTGSVNDHAVITSEFDSCNTSSSVSLTTNSVLREQRILNRLKEEKFVLRAELVRWLASFEKDKPTSLDRKTIDRILVRLQEQGLCKCIHVSVPVITNCGRSRTNTVIIHPSVQPSLLDLSGEILNRIRSFEKHVHSLGSSRHKINEPLPVLDNVMRIKNSSITEGRIAKSDTLNANSRLLSKMARAKLLHSFLWMYVSDLPGWDKTVSNVSQVRNCKPFSLEAAKNDMPIELLFKVAGSESMSEKMTEKFKGGVRLSELSHEEYRIMMETQAIGKISLIFDILRRLKLIRLVHEKQLDDGFNVPFVTFIHALEIKPYIEEPPSFVDMFASGSADLRPRIRHDFVLLSREAVDEYWNTLEYCYAAADPKAAVFSFPGCSVPEVFHHRSWASPHALSMNKRATVIKRIANDHSKQKLSYRECEKMAREFNIALHQVLAVYYDSYYFVPNQHHGIVESLTGRRSSKRKRFYLAKEGQKSREQFAEKSNGEFGTNECVQQDMESLKFSLRTGQDSNMMKYQVVDALNNQTSDEHDNSVDMESNEPSTSENRCCDFNQSKNMPPSDSCRFIWTDEADKNLIMQYARHRATIGARYQRVDWSKLRELPAPLKTCARRMSLLKKNRGFRRALMKFCTFLCQRYAKYLKGVYGTLGNKNIHVLGFGKVPENDLINEWDDFNDEHVKEALKEVLYFKRIAKLGECQRVGSTLKRVKTKKCLDPTFVDSGLHDMELKDLESGKNLHQKYFSSINEGKDLSTQVYTSLAVSNAVELLKVVFLSASSPQLEKSVAFTLRHYSELDLFAAFSYLRDKKIMIGGNGGPFVLSQHFLNSLNRSPFLPRTGNRAAHFSRWLGENKDNLIDGIYLRPELECGDLFQLFALLYSGELSVCPCVPDEGVGEAEDVRIGKRKAENDDTCEFSKSKKLKFFGDIDCISRREKGFPGIMVSLHQSALPGGKALDVLGNNEASRTLLCGNKDKTPKNNSFFEFEMVSGSPDHGSMKPATSMPCVSCWAAMAEYMRFQMKTSFFNEMNLPNAEMFKTIYSVIQKAGDQGLCLDQIRQGLNVPWEHCCKQIVDVLIAFRQVVMVNAFDSVRIVDALYYPKYFLTSNADCQQVVLAQTIGRMADAHLSSELEEQDMISASSCSKSVKTDYAVHNITVLNCPTSVLAERELYEGLEDVGQNELSVESSIDKSNAARINDKTQIPILPWLNGDGTINTIVYNKIVRCVLGTIMQNPGITEDDIIKQIDVLNPQSCRSLLQLMILNNHLTVREIQVSISCRPHGLLGNLFKSDFSESKSVYRRHFFANTKCATLL